MECAGHASESKAFREKECRAVGDINSELEKAVIMSVCYAR